MPTIGIWTWSVRRLMGPMYPGLDLAAEAHPADDRFGQAMSRCSIPETRCASAASPTSTSATWPPQHTDDAYLDELRGRLDAAGVRVFTFLVDDGDISAADDAARARRGRDQKLDRRGGAARGALRARRGRAQRRAPPDDPAIRRSAGSMLTLADYARERGVELITETWRPLAMPPENVRALRAITGNSVGLCADFNNYHAYSGDRKI